MAGLERPSSARGPVVAFVIGMSKLSDLYGLPEGFDPWSFQRAYALECEHWVRTGRAAALESGPPEAFWVAVRERTNSVRHSATVSDSSTANGEELRRLVTQLITYGGALAESSEDLIARRHGSDVLYNLDFSLLAPILFDRPSAGSKEFIVEAARATEHVLDADYSERPFQIVLSPFTIAEFFDQIQHALGHVNSPHFEWYGAVDFGLLREELMTSARLRADLQAFTERGIRATLERPFERLLDLLDRGAVCGIADVMDVGSLRNEAEGGAAEFDALFKEQRAARLERDRSRSRSDSEFHYRMDAGNSFLTLAAARSQDAANLLFVTTTGVNRRQCRREGLDLARLNPTPLFVLRAHLLSQAGMIDDDVGVTDRLAHECVAYAQSLDRYESLASVSPWERRRVLRFFEEDLGPMISSPTQSDISAEAQVEEILDTLSDIEAMRSAVAEATTGVRESAEQLEGELRTFEIGYLEDFDLHDDPIVRRLQRELGVFEGRTRAGR
jgi:hypothetical protein